MVASVDCGKRDACSDAGHREPVALALGESHEQADPDTQRRGYVPAWKDASVDPALAQDPPIDLPEDRVDAAGQLSRKDRAGRFGREERVERIGRHRRSGEAGQQAVSAIEPVGNGQNDQAGWRYGVGQQVEQFQQVRQHWPQRIDRAGQSPVGEQQMVPVHPAAFQGVIRLRLGEPADLLVGQQDAG